MSDVEDRLIRGLRNALLCAISNVLKNVSLVYSVPSNVDVIKYTKDHQHLKSRGDDNILLECFIAYFLTSLCSSSGSLSFFLIDEVLLTIAGAIFSHVRALRESKSLKIAETCRLYHTYGDIIAQTFVSALSLTFQFFHLCTTIGEQSGCWDTLLTDTSSLLKQIKTEQRFGALMPDLNISPNASTATLASTLASSRLTDLSHHILNRLTSWPSPLLDGRYSLLGFWAAHSKKPWTGTAAISRVDTQHFKKVVLLCRQTLGDLPLTWLNLTHLTAFMDISVFEIYHKNGAIPGKLPLSSSSAEALMPFPPLGRLAVRARTRAQFTLVSSGTLRENPFGWLQVLALYQILLTLPHAISSFDVAPLTVTCWSKLQQNLKGETKEACDTDSAWDSVFNVFDIPMRTCLSESDLDARVLCKHLLRMTAVSLLKSQDPPLDLRAFVALTWLTTTFNPTVVKEVAIYICTHTQHGVHTHTHTHHCVPTHRHRHTDRQHCVHTHTHTFPSRAVCIVFGTTWA